MNWKFWNIKLVWADALERLRFDQELLFKERTVSDALRAKLSIPLDLVEERNRLRKELESVKDALTQTERELETAKGLRNFLRRENDTLKDMLGFIDMVPHNEAAAIGLMEQLAVVTSNTPWWKSLNGLLESEAQQAVNDTLMPDLSNDAVNVRRGRAAMVKDLQGILRRLWLQAQQQAPNPKPPPR